MPLGHELLLESGPEPGIVSRAHSYPLDPLADSRWPEFVARHPRATVFHSQPWLEVLRRTYGYRPLAFTTSPPAVPLENGLVSCQMESWLTGSRLVSLPFSDHCDPLVDRESDLRAILSGMEAASRQAGLDYLEFRPVTQALHRVGALSRSTYAYCFHDLDLRPDPATLYENLHKSTKRNIQRAGRSELIYQEGRSRYLLDIFLELYVSTRRRHGVPPQPKAWFSNLIACFGAALQIRVAFRLRQPIAAILTLRHKNVVTYKYGCSDKAFHNLGATHSLLWRALREERQSGATSLDLGRSERANQGLVTFKDRLGARQSVLTYSRFTASPRSRSHYGAAGPAWLENGARRLLRRLPDRLLIASGTWLYRHIG
ncbi:MAG: GNAT family N-acetyltransferase [Acidobacteriota bacterium]